MAENREITDFVGTDGSSQHGTKGVILQRRSEREFLSVKEKTTVPGHRNINVEEVISAAVCPSCGEAVIVEGSEGEHYGDGSVQTYMYTSVGHCWYCGTMCEVDITFNVDGVSLR